MWWPHLFTEIALISHLHTRSSSEWWGQDTCPCANCQRVQKGWGCTTTEESEVSIRASSLYWDSDALSKKVMVFSFLEFFRKGGHRLISSMAGMRRSLWISGQMSSVFEWKELRQQSLGTQVLEVKTYTSRNIPLELNEGHRSCTQGYLFLSRLGRFRGKGGRDEVVRNKWRNFPITIWASWEKGVA